MEAGAATAPAATRARTRTKKKPRSARGKMPWWMWVAVAAIVVFCLFPFYWLISISLKTGNDLQSSSLIPPNPTLANYKEIFKNPDFTKALRNSAVVALSTTALALAVGSFCAYALARLKLRGKFVILAIVLTISTFPQIAIAAPLFKLWSDIGLFNTWLGLIIPYLTFALPLTVYILVSFFREIPKDLEEAALVDGATHFEAFRKVVVPLAVRGLATAGILTVSGAWNEFLLAVTLTSSSKARTVPAAIAFFTGATEHEGPYGSIAAASVVISVPLILMGLLFQKRIVAGLTAGGEKGCDDRCGWRPVPCRLCSVGEPAPGSGRDARAGAAAAATVWSSRRPAASAAGGIGLPGRAAVVVAFEGGAQTGRRRRRGPPGLALPREAPRPPAQPGALARSRGRRPPPR